MHSSQYILSELQAHCRTSPVTTLRLTECADDDLGILPDVLPDILLSIKQLQYFTYGITKYWEDYSIGGPRIKPASIGMALEPHTSTLVELIIYHEEGAKFLPTPSFGTLIHYSNLKRLAIPEPFLTFESSLTIHDKLPSSLEALQLQYPMGCCRQGLDGQRQSRHTRMRGLMDNKSSCLPRLKRVIWCFQQGDCCLEEGCEIQDWTDRNTVLDLAKEFEAADVKFRWMSRSWFSSFL